jgi:predicted DNA-binding transcriptional regulator YafY
MPANTNGSTLARQWELLKLIPAKPPGLTVLQLQRELTTCGYTVTKRTVQRDLTELSRLFPLATSEDGTTQGWHWLDGTAVQLPSVSIADAQSLLLVRDLLKPLVPRILWSSLDQRFEMASRKLESLGKVNALARWTRKVRAVPSTLPLLPPQVDAAVMLAVQDALLQERSCEVTYQSFGADTAKQLTLHPQGLIQRGPVTYLVATAYDYEAPRLYAMHRIHGAQCLDTPSKTPPNFDLDDYISTGAPQFGSGEPITLQARVSDVLAAILRETPIASDQKLDSLNEDWWNLSATVLDTWQLRWWLKSQGQDIIVRSPKPLRQELMRELRSTLDNYRDRTLNK